MMGRPRADRGGDLFFIAVLIAGTAWFGHWATLSLALFGGVVLNLIFPEPTVWRD